MSNNDETKRLVSGESVPEDEGALDRALRPQTLDDLIGQDKVRDNLRILIQAARARGEALDHVLIYGPPGLGKTTLSHIISNEMQANLRVTSGPAIERAGDLAAILTNLRANDVLFIDEIHRLNRAVEEVLYPAMEDNALDLVIGKGPAARTVRLKLPPITVVGATTRLALMTAPLRARFGATYRVDFYPLDAMEKIVSRAARLLNSKIEPAALTDVARRARGTPRVAIRLLRRVRDYAQVKGDGFITEGLPAPRSHSWKWIRLGWMIWIAACCAPSSRSLTAVRWGWRPSPPASAKKATRSWTWWSRIFCNLAFWIAPRAGA